MQTAYEKILTKELDNANRERLVRKQFIKLHEKLFSLEEEINKLTYCDIKLEVRKINEDDPDNGKIHFQHLEWKNNNNNMQILNKLVRDDHHR